MIGWAILFGCCCGYGENTVVIEDPVSIQNFLLDCGCSEIIATEIHLVQFIILCIGGMGEEHNINAS